MVPAHKTFGSEPAASILFVVTADEELTSLVMPCLQIFRELFRAESGVEALALYRANRPNLVLSALDAGDMTGLELCNRIRAVDAEAQIVLIGRKPDESIYQRTMEAGAVRFVDMDGHAADALTSLLIERHACCVSQRSRRLTDALSRLQADALFNLPTPVALLSDSGDPISVNRAFGSCFGGQGTPQPVTLAELVAALPAAESPGGWGSLLEAAAHRREWSGTVTCRELHTSRMYISAALYGFQSGTAAEAGAQMLLLNDITPAEERQSQLAIQRESAFELLSSINDTKESHTLLQFLTSPTVAQPFSLRAELASVVASFSERLKTYRKEIRSTTPHYLPDLFAGSHSAVYHAISCLLANALKNCSGNELQLRVDVRGKNHDGSHIQFDVEFDNDRAAASSFETMRDYVTGLKLADEQERSPWTGLSLALALIEKMGGTAWVKSRAAHRSTYCFSVTLPETSTIDATADNDVTPAGSRTAGLGSLCLKALPTRLRVLLADDNEVDLHTICRLLEGMDCDVRSVTNGLEAVENYDAASCDLVFMDILMPVMDGFEATRMIREKERVTGGGRTPIIALTSYSLKAIHEKCVQVGMDSYLHKPVSVSDITALLNSVGSGSLATDDSTLHPQETTSIPRLDIRGALKNLDSNVELYREIVSLFTSNVTTVHNNLVTAISSGSLPDILQCAHKLKGMSSNIGAKRYGEVARVIEESADEGRLEDSAGWLKRLETEFPLLLDAIAAIDWQELR